MKDFLVRPVVKHAILAILTVAVSTFVSMVGIFKSSGLIFGIMLALSIVSALAYIIATALYAKNEVNSRRVTEVQAHQLEAFKDMANNIVSICQDNVEAVNRCIHEASKNGQVNLNIWGFNNICKNICGCAFNTVKRLSGSEHYSIEYVRLIEDDKEDSVATVGYANQNMQAPRTFNRVRPFKNIDKDAFRDLWLFKNSNSNIAISFGKEEIANDLARPNNKTLYVGIPVLCHDEKMVGLLQIIGTDNTKLGCLTKSEAEEVVGKFFVPYANLFLLLHKMEKALFAGTNKNPIDYYLEGWKR